MVAVGSTRLPVTDAEADPKLRLSYWAVTTGQITDSHKNNSFQSLE